VSHAIAVSLTNEVSDPSDLLGHPVVAGPPQEMSAAPFGAKDSSGVRAVVLGAVLA
jgi:hypothetical protein